MNLAFINPSLRPDSKRRQLPVGLAYVLTAVKKAGFDFDLIDMDIDNLSMEDLKKILAGKTYDVYGLGCIVTGFKFVRKITDIIKGINPNATIIAGNSVASSIPEILLNNTGVDICVMGEGDFTIVELLRRLASGRGIGDVHGIVFREETSIRHTSNRPAIKNIDNIGFPDWDVFDLDKYSRYGNINVNAFSSDKLTSFPLNTARGCPFNCTFCYHAFKEVKYRKYSDGAVMAEIERLHFKYGCDYVEFWDELSFPTIRSVESMIERFKRLKFKVKWATVTRGDLFKKEHLSLIKELKSLGLENVAFSLENASDEILKAMNKRMNVSQFIEQAKILWKGGVTPLTSVIFGYPQETPETIKKTLDVCEECNVYPSVGFLLPLPGTQIYEWAKQKGHISGEVEYLNRIGDRQDFHINLTGMPDDELVSLVQSGLENLAKKQGLEMKSVFKTTTYQKPHEIKIV